MRKEGGQEAAEKFCRTFPGSSHLHLSTHFPGGKDQDLGLYCSRTTQLRILQAPLGRSVSLQ